MNRIIILFLCILNIIFAAEALDVSGIKVSSDRDTLIAEQIISRLREGEHTFGEKVMLAALEFNGSRRDDYYTADKNASLRLNLQSFTPLMFVNSAVAIARATEVPGLPDWRDIAGELERMACVKGVDAGYPSIMYHTSEWIIDNLSRGNLKELTENYSGAIDKTKSLDEMTRKRENFAALSDSAIYERVRMKEMGFRTLRVPMLKKETIKKREILEDLQDGDIIILVANREGIDCYDIGIVAIKEDGPHLIHVSPQSGIVVEEKETLMRYLPLVTKNYQGYRIIRPVL